MMGMFCTGQKGLIVLFIPTVDYYLLDKLVQRILLSIIKHSRKDLYLDSSHLLYFGRDGPNVNFHLKRSWVVSCYHTPPLSN